MGPFFVSREGAKDGRMQFLIRVNLCHLWQGFLYSLALIPLEFRSLFCTLHKRAFGRWFNPSHIVGTFVVYTKNCVNRVYSKTRNQ